MIETKGTLRPLTTGLFSFAHGLSDDTFDSILTHVTELALESLLKGH